MRARPRPDILANARPVLLAGHIHEAKQRLQLICGRAGCVPRAAWEGASCARKVPCCWRNIDGRMRTTKYLLLQRRLVEVGNADIDRVCGTCVCNKKGRRERERRTGSVEVNNPSQIKIKTNDREVNRAIAMSMCRSMCVRKSVR